MNKLKKVAKKSSSIIANFLQKKISEHLNKMHSAYPRQVSTAVVLCQLTITRFPGLGPVSNERSSNFTYSELSNISGAMGIYFGFFY